MEQPGRQTISQNTDAGHPHDDLSGDNSRMTEASKGFINDENGGSQENHGVDQRGQNFRSPVAKSVSGWSALLTDTISKIGNQNGRKITEIVGGIRDEGHAVGITPPNDLGHRDYEIKCQR